MTPPNAIFHLSFPVASLSASLDFYQRCLGAIPGRTGDGWVDVLLFGHQLTLHERPEQVLPRAARGVRHFGAILGWEAWEDLRDRVLAFDPALAAGIQPRLTGTPEEHVKFLLEDPDGNVVELKAYRTMETVFDKSASPR